ncbi:hypothetical protein H4582DRAFT_2057299 [Lactarius indigo]|nr:hypothetical protein H4582DRAFT_2057299 [Lactarius indigo]
MFVSTLSRVDLPSGSSVGIIFSFRLASITDVQGTPTCKLVQVQHLSNFIPSFSPHSSVTTTLPLWSIFKTATQYLVNPTAHLFSPYSRQPGRSGAATSVLNHLSITPTIHNATTESAAARCRLTATRNHGTTTGIQRKPVEQHIPRRQRDRDGGDGREGGSTPPTQPRAPICDIGGGVLYSPSAPTVPRQ